MPAFRRTARASPRRSRNCATPEPRRFFADSERSQERPRPARRALAALERDDVFFVAQLRPPRALDARLAEYAGADRRQGRALPILGRHMGGHDDRPRAAFVLDGYRISVTHCSFTSFLSTAARSLLDRLRRAALTPAFARPWVAPRQRARRSRKALRPAGGRLLGGAQRSDFARIGSLGDEVGEAPAAALERARPRRSRRRGRRDGRRRSTTANPPRARRALPATGSARHSAPPPSGGPRPSRPKKSAPGRGGRSPASAR